MPPSVEEHWRAQAEANTAGVPKLHRFSYRAQRWDAHPHSSDCMHSSFGPGVFDGEMAELAVVLSRAATNAKGMLLAGGPQNQPDPRHNLSSALAVV